MTDADNHQTEKSKMIRSALLALVTIAMTASPAIAEPIQWTIASGGNGHWYEFVDENPLTWEAAQAYAQSRGGYLATITSPEENAFIVSSLNIQSIPECSCTWLGGFQNTASPAYSEPAGGWEWVTGEPFTYSNWLPGEPNNYDGDERYLTISLAHGAWNDHFQDAFPHQVIEWDTNPFTILTKTIDFEGLTVGLIPTFDAPIDVGDGFYIHTNGFAGDTRYNTEIFETGTANGKAVRDGRDNEYGAGLYICRYDATDFTLQSFDGADFNTASDSRPVRLGTFDEVWSEGMPVTAEYSYAVPQGSFASFAAGYTATCFGFDVMDYDNYDQAIDNIVVEYWAAATCTSIGSLAPSTSSLAADQNNHCEDWFGVSQPGADLRNAVLSLADLGSANLAGSLLMNADLSGASLVNASLVNARLEGANLRGTAMTSANLSFANLTGATYDELTIFPSGNTYDLSPSGLDGGITPWGARMIPTPEPGLGSMLTIGAGCLFVFTARKRSRSSNRFLN